MRHGKIDIVKEIVWAVIVYALYFVYCFVILLLFHLIFYSILNLSWTINKIALMAFAACTVMMGFWIYKKIKKERKK